MTGPSEAGFETAIVAALADSGGYRAVKVGNSAADKDDFDAVAGIDRAELFAFIEATQAEQWAKVVKSHGAPTAAEDAFVDRLVKEIDSRGLIDVLRQGIVYAGHEKADIKLMYAAPASGLNADLDKRYRSNRLTVTRQLPYQAGSNKTLDLGLFVNGLPVATAELKTHLTGQTVDHAMKQYRSDRDPKNALLRRAIVHFAVDTEQVYMTTRLAGADTRFLPFNMGDGEAKGNPLNPSGYRTAYLWERVWRFEAWLDLLARFVHIDESGTTIFPRFHQWDAVLKLTGDAKQNGAGHSYLVQHSAGSGKSNTIAWLAHRLSKLHGADDKKVFDKVIVITDRIILDRQLQKTIYQFEHVHGVVEKIDGTSQQLADALNGEKARIIITTLQKFPFVMQHVEELKARNYAVIVDEAHSSQTGDSAKEMKKVLGGIGTSPEEALAAAEAFEAGVGVEELPDPVEDALAAEVEARGRQKNMSFFAFTATPKGRTLELFGTKNAEGKYEAFHLYSMKQAIEEGFIENVLANYVTYDTFFNIEKKVADDPDFDKSRAKSAIARFVSLHEYNLDQRSEVIINHFRTHVKHRVGGKAKAMVVTSSRLHALRYKRALDKYCNTHGYGDVGVIVAFSGELEDGGASWTEAKVNGFPESETPKKFDSDDWQIMVVAEKYQTGFDQPKLYAMYVDKTLSSLAAVQTLSRLNRTHRDKNGTFVLDFRNTVEDIQEAFSPWFARTEANATDPHLLYDTHAEVKHFDVVRAEEVDSVVSLLLLDPDKNHERIYKGLQPAVDRFIAMDEEDQDGFRDALTRFTRIYSFLSQVVAFIDVKLERDYLFCRSLARLIRKDASGGVDLGDVVELSHFRIEAHDAVDGSLSVDAGELTTIYGGAGSFREPVEEPLSQIIERINAAYGTHISPADALFIEQIGADIVSNETVQMEATANDEKSFAVGFDKTWTNALAGRIGSNEKFAFELLDNAELREMLLTTELPAIYAKARVAGQRTRPIGDLIGPDREDKFLEYKSTMRWDVRESKKNPVMENSVVKTIAGFANSSAGGTLLVGVTDEGAIYGLEADYATFSKRVERGDHDLWGQHLKNLLDRLGKAAAALVDWDFHVVDGHDIVRVNVEPSGHPVYETKKGEQYFWWRTPVSTELVKDSDEIAHIIARRWA